MILVTKSIEWDMGHRLPNHYGKCKHPHGHHYKLEVTLTGPVQTKLNDSSEGMILDFKDLKAVLKNEIHKCLDHKFMVSECDPFFIPFINSHSELKCGFVITPFVPTAENIVRWCYDKIKDKIPPNITVYKCRLYETPTSHAEYIPRELS